MILHQEIAGHFGEVPLREFASLSATLGALSGAEGATNDEDPFGDFGRQMHLLATELTDYVDIAETIVLTPDGDRYSVENFDDGHKRIPRRNLPRPRQTADNANFLRAGRLLLASRY